MNNTEYKELIEELNNLEVIAYGYNINGEVLGMDCSDFEQIMVDSATAITELMAQLSIATLERDAAIADLEMLKCSISCEPNQSYSNKPFIECYKNGKKKNCRWS